MFKLHKKALAIVLTALMLFSLLFTFSLKSASADTVTETIKLKIGSKTVYVNGQPKQMDVAPFIDPHSNRTLVPVRFVAEGLGGEVSWHPHERFVGVLVGKKKVGLWIGRKTAKVSKQAADWDKFDEFKDTVTDQAPEIVPPGRTMIPLRFVSESVGAKVDWNGKTREITITLSYMPVDVGDILVSVPFDRWAPNNDSGYCISPGSSFAFDKDHMSIFAYGEKRMTPKPGTTPHYVLWKKYLFKLDALTGIKLGIKEIFDNVDPDWYGDSEAHSVVDWLAYDHGYLYCATPNYGRAPRKFLDTKVYLKKLDPVHMSVIWAKMINVHDTFFPTARYANNDPYRGGFIGFWDHNRVPLCFTSDGSTIMWVASIYMQGIYKNRYSTYDFVVLAGIDPKTGNIKWKKIHDGWAYYDMIKRGMPIYNGHYAYLFEEIVCPRVSCYACCKSSEEKPSYDGNMLLMSNTNYQTDYLTALTKKLIQETHAKANTQYKPPEVYAPERLLCVDMNTGNTVWKHYFIDNAYEGGLVQRSPQIFLVNKILYLPETTYDPGVQFPVGEDFGVELLRFDAMTGKQILPLPHKSLGIMSIQTGWTPAVLPQGVLNFDHGTPFVEANNNIFLYAQDMTYDPNQHRSNNSWASERGVFFYFTNINDIPFTTYEDTGYNRQEGVGFNELYNVYKHFTYRYYNPSFNPKVHIHNSEPNNRINEILEWHTNNKLYLFIKHPTDYGNGPGAYPGIICVKIGKK